MDWRHDAVCRNEDPELFFPVGNSGPAKLQIAEAKPVCCQCPVSWQCLAWALVMWIAAAKVLSDLAVRDKDMFTMTKDGDCP